MVSIGLGIIDWENLAIWRRYCFALSYLILFLRSVNTFFSSRWSQLYGIGSNHPSFINYFMKIRKKLLLIE
jgi:hypothetical protein